MNFNASEKVSDAETQKENTPAQEAVNNIYDLADDLDLEKDQEHYQVLHKSAIKINEGNYNKGQQILEGQGKWNDNLRKSVVSLNRFSQKEKEEESINFAGAQEKIQSYADGLAELGSSNDRQEALEIESILRGMDRPSMSGIDGINDTLKYIESLLESKVNAGAEMTSESFKDLQEKRSIRDALFEEKQRRMAEMKKARAVSNQKKLENEANNKDQEKLDEFRTKHGFNGGVDEIQTENEDPFKNVLTSMDTAEVLKAKSKDNTYNPNLGVATMMDSFKEVYSDEEQLVNRLKELKVEFQVALKKVKQEHPDKHPNSWEIGASKIIIRNLKPEERALMDDNLTKFLVLKDGGNTMTMGIDMPMGDFIKFLNKIKE